MAIIDMLGFKNQLWNVQKEQIPNGLTNLYEKYFLLDAVKRSKIYRFQLSAKNSVEHINYETPHVIISDTILLWSEEIYIDNLIIAIATLINNALIYGIPLRGTLAYGNCIIDTS